MCMCVVGGGCEIIFNQAIDIITEGVRTKFFCFGGVYCLSFC